MNSDPQSSPPPANGTSCNGVTISLAIAVVVFGIAGYRYGYSDGPLASFAFTIGGIILGLAATPVVFLLLMIVIHVGVKTEDWFRKRRG